MLHGVKKIKFRKGQDANQALVHKLAADFVRHEHIETTLGRAKMLKSVMDRLTNRAKTRNQSHRNILLRTLRDKALVEKLFAIGEERFAKRHTGFVTLKRLGMRQGDGAEVARVEWVEGGVVKGKAEVVVEVQAEAGSEKIEAGNKKVTKQGKSTFKKKTAKKISTTKKTKTA